MTVEEREEKFRQIFNIANKWFHQCESRQKMKVLEDQILKLADEIRSEDLQEAHRDACEDWV